MAPSPCRRAILAALTASAVACGGDGPTPAPQESGKPDPTGPAGPTGYTPPPSPFACHVEADLPAPVEREPGCPEPAPLEAPRELRVPVGWSFWTGRARVAVDASGTLAHYASWGLATGYWSGEVTFVRPDGSIARTERAQHVLVTAGNEGFLAVGVLGEVTLYGRDGSTGHEPRADWPGTLAAGNSSGDGGRMAVRADGRGGVFIALLRRGDGGDGELWAAHVLSDGSVEAPPFRVAAIPDEDRLLSDAHGPARALGAVAIAEDGDGRILVTWGGGWAACGAGTIAARWFLRDGTPLGDVFRAGSGLEPASPWGATLLRMLDGSLALRMPGAGWVRRFAGGVPAGGPVPEWLLSRHLEEATELPQRGLLAFARAAGKHGVGARVELVDGGGRICESHALPPETPRVERSTPAIGLDGTIVQHARTDGPPTVAVLRVWPGALR